MSAVVLERCSGRERLGFKGPRAADWLSAQGLELPLGSNSWAGPQSNEAPGLLVARLGASEFFLEYGLERSSATGLLAKLNQHPSGVYPVLREDWAFVLAGEGVHDVLAQVCNVNFAELSLESRPLIMTLMIGVAVLVVPEASADGRRYRIWCDPTFGAYLYESLGVVVVECGGRYMGASV